MKNATLCIVQCSCNALSHKTLQYKTYNYYIYQVLIYMVHWTCCNRKHNIINQDALDQCFSNISCTLLPTGCKDMLQHLVSFSKANRSQLQNLAVL